MGFVSGHCYRGPVQVEAEKGVLECYIYIYLEKDWFKQEINVKRD